MVILLLCISFAVGFGGPGSQRLSPGVCLRKAEGTASPDGGPGLWGLNGDCGHGAGQAAPGVPSRPLKDIYSPS